MNETPLRIAPGLTRHHNRLVLVAALLLSFTPPAWSDVLIGYYTINAKYNTAGCPELAESPESYDPYLYQTQLPPGPVISAGLAAGDYRLVVTHIGRHGPADVRVWLGDPGSDFTFLINSPGIVGRTTRFLHPGGNIALYVCDQDPGDNDPKSWTKVALFMNLPNSKEQCKKRPGWPNYGFKNHGQCIKFVNTGKGHPVYPPTPINPIYPPTPNHDPLINEKPILNKKPKKK